MGFRIFLSPEGKDTNSGDKNLPLKTLNAALYKIRAIKQAGELPDGGVNVTLRGGVYPLKDPLTLTEADSGEKDKPVIFQAYEGENPIISGGVKLNLDWKPFRNGIMQAEMPGNFAVERLFINGKLQHMARYPNYDPDARFFHGTSPDSISPERVKEWKNPVGGYVHALHSHMWGSKHYQITGVGNKGNLTLKGGWQENRGGNSDDPEFVGGYHTEFLFVENIFEELDAPGEYFFDTETRILYLIPEQGVDLDKAEVVVAGIKELISIKGELNSPVRHIEFNGLTFEHTGHVFMEPYERILRGDWSIARLGALFFENTENCQIQDCTFTNLGGNGIFISDYNRHVDIKGCLFEKLGESAICFLGSNNAVRSGAIRYENSIPLDEIDPTPGPKSPEYPAFCHVDDNLIRQVGMIGKQTAGVFIAKSQNIVVSHNTMYDMPRASICINDGTWGGHIIEFNDVFDTVKESGDHGPFNSWGRDRHWQTSHASGFEKGDQSRARVDSRLDTDDPVIIRNNRWTHNSGFSWGIDLDDGTSNYQVYNNLCLGCSYKLREGFYRLIENNICIGPNPPGKHCCYLQNQDIIRRNIIVNTSDTEMWKGIHHQPNQVKQVDYQLFWTLNGKPPTFLSTGKSLPEYKETMTLGEWQAMGHDIHSIFADPMFIDPENGDFRVKPGSPAFALGFKNFPMDQFGVRKPDFKNMVDADRGNRAIFTQSFLAEQGRDKTTYIWLGATIRNLVGWEEMSAAAMGQETGVVLIDIPADSGAAEAGFIPGDVILTINGKENHSIEDFKKLMSEYSGQQVTCRVTGNPPDRDVAFIARDLSK